MMPIVELLPVPTYVGRVRMMRGRRWSISDPFPTRRQAIKWCASYLDRAEVAELDVVRHDAPGAWGPRAELYGVIWRARISRYDFSTLPKPTEPLKT